MSFAPTAGYCTGNVIGVTPTETVEDVYEPFLIQQGLLQRTPRGRVATPLAFAHLGVALSGGGDAGPSLFG